MNRKVSTHALVRTMYLLLGMLLWTTFLVQPANSQQQTPQDNASLTIPRGTILPVRLNSTISSAKSTPGQVITGRIMQDVPLTPGVKFHEGSKVLGHIVEVTPASTTAPARISFQFDKLVFSHRLISITTNLRTIAGFANRRSSNTSNRPQRERRLPLVNDGANRRRRCLRRRRSRHRGR
jgi:hypothetical protein